jgi:hypothetical protein
MHASARRASSPSRRARGERQVQNPELPVVGEAIWTSADGLGITVRIALHALRRFPGGTVLDWSVTPLHGPGLRPSDPVPSRLDLGLSRPDESYPNIVLIDAARSEVYRLLTLKGSDSRCLCTRLSRNSLRIGYTSLFQIAFPALPDDLATHARRWRRSGMPLHRPTHGSVQPASEGRANERGDHTAAALIRHFKG